MKTYDSFSFDSYSFNPKDGRIELNYSLDDDVHFTETILLPGSKFTADDAELDAALFALHLIGGISYFKTCLPKKIEMRSGTLTKEQADFWNTVYENGLGEFAFKNKINLWGSIKFPSEDPTPDSQPPPPQTKSPTPKNVLVPIGGGKDSIVTAELCRKARLHCVLFRIGRHPFIDELAKVANIPLLTVDRKLSPALFKLNEEGALNGHVPITAYLSFLTIVIAKLYGFDAVMMSNERSASEGNVMFEGKEINHQWSKSLEFERAFQQYIAAGVSKDIQCYSILRPLSELSIVRIFAEFPQYFEHVTSCNANWRIMKERPAERWCGKCPKCAFAFLLISAYLKKEEVVKMFGKNLFEDETLLPLYRELLGLEGFKPFECVGTKEESIAAFALAHEGHELDDTVVMKMFLKDVLPGVKDPEALIKEALTPSIDHAIPQGMTRVVFNS